MGQANRISGTASLLNSHYHFPRRVPAGSGAELSFGVFPPGFPLGLRLPGITDQRDATTPCVRRSRRATATPAAPRSDWSRVSRSCSRWEARNGARTWRRSSTRWHRSSRSAGTSARTRKRIARHGLEHHPRYLSGLSEEQLIATYAAADLFVFPSYFEGFGFPVLEAMGAGCPVIAAWAGAIRGLLDDPVRRASLAQSGIARAATFTWERAARQTVEAYRRALGG